MTIFIDNNLLPLLITFFVFSDFSSHFFYYSKKNLIGLDSMGGWFLIIPS